MGVRMILLFSISILSLTFKFNSALTGYTATMSCLPDDTTLLMIKQCILNVRLASSPLNGLSAL